MLKEFNLIDEISDKVVKTIIALADSNQDKRIQRQEFSRIIKLLKAYKKSNLGFAIFEIADKDHDGVVSQKELQLLVA